MTDFQGRDYVALAGTCKLFRHHMDEDFFEVSIWRPVRCAVVNLTSVLLQGNRSSSHNPIEPFSRSIADWREDHPRAVLCGDLYPTNTRRRYSQWIDNNDDEGESQPHPYTHGHYVPPGARSGWTDAQYTVYKEEQESWRRNRHQARLLGLEAMADGPRIVRRRSLLDSNNCRANYHDYGLCACKADGVLAPSVVEDADETSETSYSSSDSDGMYSTAYAKY